MVLGFQKSDNFGPLGALSTGADGLGATGLVGAEKKPMNITILAMSVQYSGVRMNLQEIS